MAVTAEDLIIRIQAINMADVELNKLSKQVRKLEDDAKGIERGFKFAGLNVLFFGMFLERTFGSIVRSGVNTFREITEATAGTNTALSQLSAGVTFLQFTIGDALNSVLEPLLPTILGIIEAVGDFVQQHPEVALMAVALAAIGAAMVPIGASLVFFQNIGAVGGIAGLFGSGGALAAIATPLGAIALILGGLIITSKEFKPVWKAVGDVVNAVFDVIKAGIQVLNDFGIDVEALAILVKFVVIPVLWALKLVLEGIAFALEKIHEFLNLPAAQAGISMVKNPIGTISDVLSGKYNDLLRGQPSSTNTTANNVTINMTSSGNPAADGAAAGTAFMNRIGGYASTSTTIGG